MPEPAAGGRERIGFVGLGAMGRGMARNLLRAGHALTVFDLSRAAVDALVTDGAQAADGPAAVAAWCDRLFLCLPFAPQVREVLLGPGGVASAARAGLAVIDTTTLLQSDAVDIASAADQAGLRYNDCPVSGMPMRAESGTLTVMFGGTDADFADARPLLDVIGADVIHCGPVGSGQLMKAVNNVVYDINIAAVCEILPLAVKAGLDPETVTAVLTSGSARSFAGDHFLPRILDRRFAGDFSLRSAWKDVVNLQQAAVRTGAMTPLTAAMSGIYQTAIAQGHGDEPKSAMVKVYEAVLGLEVHRDGSESG